LVTALPLIQSTFTLAPVVTLPPLFSLAYTSLAFGCLPTPNKQLALRLAAELLVPPPRSVVILTTTAQTFTAT
jgi:hypothetical protein